MMRLALIEALLFALPFLLYGGYLALRGKTGIIRSELQSKSLGRLAFAGFALMALGFIMLAASSGDEPGTVYRPTQYKDGKLVPGGFEKPSPSQETPAQSMGEGR